MLAADNNSSYNSPAKILHWAIAAAIIIQFILAKLAENTNQEIRELALLANHKSVGITILALAIVRLLWRIRSGVPSLPVTMPRWQVVASHISHWSFYFLLFALPLSGWLMSSASAYSVSWFNLFALPDFVAADPDLAHDLEDLHEVLSRLLLILSIIHIGAALKHAIFNRDGVFERMTSLAGMLVFTAIIAAGILILARAGANNPAVEQEKTDSARIMEPATADFVYETRLPEWQLDYQNSEIRFIAEQAGAKFEGVWPRWQAKLYFSAQDLNQSVFDVTINTDQAETWDDERDEALKSEEWFDAANFPQAYYRANRFEKINDNKFVSKGELVIKGKALPVDLYFDIEQQDSQNGLTGNNKILILNGSAEIDRLALDVGTGEWADTTWVGRMVQVQVRLQAAVADQQQ